MKNNKYGFVGWAGRLMLIACLMVVMSAGASWAYSVSGFVNYTGSKTGRVYLSVYNQYGSTGLGTSLSAPLTPPRSYTIRGVQAGSYTIKAFMDTLGFGVANVIHPQGQSASITVSTTDLTGKDITLAGPGTPALSPPQGVMVTPGDNSALVMWKGPSDSNGVEAAQSYNVYWSTSSDVLGTYTTLGGSITGIPAHDDGHQFVSGLSNGSTLYFAVTTLIGTAESSAVTSGLITIGTPSSGTDVSGTVTLSGTSSSNPLFIGISPPNGGLVAYKIISAPTSYPQGFIVSGVPAGNYSVFASIDNNTNGRIDLGDIHTSRSSEQLITVSSTPVSGITVPLTGANAEVSTITTHGTTNGSDWYNLRFQADGLIKLPVTLVMNGGPNVSGPLDLGLSQWGGFQYTTSTIPRPVVGQNYNFDVGYSDTSSETINSPITAVLDDFATPLSPTGIIVNPPPSSLTFNWAPPGPLPGYPYSYSFWMNIPNGWFNSEPYYTLPSSTTSVSPTSGEFTPLSGVNYSWYVALKDGNGNSTQASTNFTSGSGSISGNVTSDGIHGIANTYAVLLDPMTGGAPVTGIPAVLTDSATGAYTINNIPAGNYKLYFSAGPGYQSQYFDNQNNFGAAQWMTVTVNNTLTANALLQPTTAPGSGTIAGVVVNASTLQPIFNASIQLLNTSNSPIGGVQPVLTTSTGEFQISAIPAGNYKLRISAADYLTSTPVTVYSVVSGVLTPASISLPPIPATITYTSKVTDNSSVAISGAQIDVFAGNVTINAATTAGDGTFSISVPSQTPFYLRISKTGYDPTITSIMSFNKDVDNSDRPYSLQTTADVAAWYTQGTGAAQFAGTGTISGKVASGANPLMTLPNVTLSASDGISSYPVCYIASGSSNVSCPPTTTATSANGKFFVLNVPSGKQINVTVTAKTGYNVGGSKSYLVAADSVSQGRIGLQTSSPSYTMISKIIDSSTSAAIANNTIMLYNDSNNPIGQITTDNNTLFTAADLLPPGMSYYLKFDPAGYLETYTANTTASANVDRSNRPFIMYPSGQLTTWGFGTASAVITGTIKDNLTGLPVAGATISSTLGTVVYDDGSGPSGASSTSAANGRFYVKDIPAALISTTVSVSVTTAAGYTLPAPRIYHVLNGTLSQGSIYLTPTTTPLSVTGSVVNRFNLPIAGAKVSAYALPGWTLINNPALTDNNGNFGLSVPSGAPFALEFISNGYRNAYTQDLQLTQNTFLTNLILMSTADYGALGWPLTGGHTFIRGMAADSLGRPMSGVTLAPSSTPSHAYTVQYVDDTTGALTGSSTFNNGFFALADAFSTDTNITLTASKTGKTFYNPSFSHLVPDSDSLCMAFDASPSPGTIGASPAYFDFLNVAVRSSTQQTITITNSGPGSIALSSSNMTGDVAEFNIQPGVTNPCPASLPATLAPGTCTLVATFSPLTAGSKTATMLLYSDAVNPVFSIPLYGTGAATVPDAPIINSIVPGDGQATVNFTAPTFNGGSTIDHYTVTSNSGPFNIGPTSPITVSSLTNGQLYTFSVTAHNSAGDGAAASTPYYLPLRAGSTDLQAAVNSVATDGAVWTQDGPATLTTPPLLIQKGVTISGGYKSDYSGLVVPPPGNGFTTITGITTGPTPGGVIIKGTGFKVIFNNVAVKAP